MRVDKVCDPRTGAEIPMMDLHSDMIMVCIRCFIQKTLREFLSDGKGFFFCWNCVRTRQSAKRTLNGIGDDR